MIELLTVSLEHTPGQLYGLVTAISRAGVDMKALSLSLCGPDMGEARMIVTDLVKAQQAVQTAGLEGSIVSAVAIVVPDHAGGLASILKVTTKASLSIQSMFTFVTRLEDKALAIGVFDNNPEAEALLTRAGFETLAQADLTDTIREPTTNIAHPLEPYLGGSFFW